MRATAMSAGFAAIVALSLGGCGGVAVGTGDGGSGSDGLAQDTAVLGSTGGQAGATAATGGRGEAGSAGSTGGVAGAAPGSSSSGGSAGDRGGAAGISGSGGSGGLIVDGGAKDAAPYCDGISQPNADCAYGLPIWSCVPTNSGGVWTFTCPVPPSDGDSAVEGVADTRGDRSADLDSSRSDGGGDAPASDATVDGKACGPNPAEVCPTSPGQCVPSSCFCSDGVWGCTADCTSGARNCVDAGTGKADGARSGVPCGSGFCTDGNYCCNANCGTCAPMGALCIQIACQPPLTWACASDADCRLVDDYCTGCDCRALGPGGTLATCTGPGVQCFVAGCFNKVPRCVEGQCVAAAKATN